MFTAIFYMNVKEYTRLIISVEASRDVVPNMFRLVNFMKLIVTAIFMCCLDGGWRCLLARQRRGSFRY